MNNDEKKSSVRCQPKTEQLTWKCEQNDGGRHMGLKLFRN